MHIAPSVIEQLKSVLQSDRVSSAYENILAQKQSVLESFQPIFSPDRIPQLTKEQFCSFLEFKNNCHWNGIARLGPKICSDMGRLRTGLLTLLDEDRPLSERYEEAIRAVPFMDRAVATPILLVHAPSSYGVWNTVSRDAMKNLGLYPPRQKGQTKGEKYCQ